MPLAQTYPAHARGGWAEHPFFARGARGPPQVPLHQLPWLSPGIPDTPGGSCQWWGGPLLGKGSNSPSNKGGSWVRDCNAPLGSLAATSMAWLLGSQLFKGTCLNSFLYDKLCTWHDGSLPVNKQRCVVCCGFVVALVAQSYHHSPSLFISNW